VTAGTSHWATRTLPVVDKGNNKITELRTILQRESQNSWVYKQTKSVNNRFTPGFVNYKKRCTRLAAASDKAYQLLAHGRWFSPASSTTFYPEHWTIVRTIFVWVSYKFLVSFRSDQYLIWSLNTCMRNWFCNPVIDWFDFDLIFGVELLTITVYIFFS
jgi:hypothetical protein